MQRLLTLLLFAALSTGAFAQNVVDVTDADINGEVTTWTSDNIYRLNGFVYVDEGETLEIEPGTVIWGKAGQGADASALIVSQGGTIIADGTRTQPIIFTADNDDISNPNDISTFSRGLWGGLIVLGKAQINTASGNGNIEGIPESPRTLYGGQTNDDNSGILRHISIRHGGSVIGGNNEINGLTLGGVGSATVIEYIEVFANKDDGIEFFGGTAQVKYAIAAFCGDDGFDYDEGFRGKGQFWAVLQDAETGNRGAEMDGGTEPEDGAPYSEPTIYNATYLGSGMMSANADNDRMLYFRDNAGGKYFNSIFGDFGGQGVSIEDLDEGEDSRARFEAGQLELTNNLWFDFGGASTVAELVDNDDPFKTDIANYLASNGNKMENPNLRGISRTANQGLDMRPSEGSVAYEPTNLRQYPSDDFFQPVNFAGAFGAGAPWIRDWTALDAYGFLAPEAGSIVDVTDADITGTTTWTSNNIYRLNGFVYVDAGETLIIEPGTVVWGRAGQGADASALIVSRDGTIRAEGTATSPIIFTADGDDVNNPNDLPTFAKGLWGGLILLGNARANTASGGGNIEGIPESDRTLYGGDNDADNSGVLRHISIRHGGSVIGGNNEINGLTLGSVGSGTVMEYIEIYSNKDDGIEWFGGTAQIKYLVSAFCGDDAIDYDEGFRGKTQFLFVLQGSDFGNRGAEQDGGTEPEDGAPYATPTFVNVTMVGSGLFTDNGDNDRALYYRDNAGGSYTNSIFTDFGNYAVKIEDLEDGEDSRARFEDGSLYLHNNLWWDFGAGTTVRDLVDDSGEFGDAIAQHLTDNGNKLENPMIGSISRMNNGQLDPRPSVMGPAMNSANAATVTDEFFSPAPYIGAFNNVTLWMDHWTALDEYGFLVDPITDVEEDNNRVSVATYPNPATDEVRVEFSLGYSSEVVIEVSDLTGNVVSSLTKSLYTASGNVQESLNVASLAQGTYIVTITTPVTVQSTTVQVVR